MRFSLSVFKRIFSLAVLMVTMIAPVRAVVIQDMFTAVIPVAAQSPEEFARGATIGLEQVLVRLTGRGDIANEPAVKSALRTADVYLLQFRYEGQTDQGVLLNLSFDQPLLEKLLREAKIPLWPADRVPVAVWLILENSPGERVLVNADSQPALTAALDAVALRRGLVLRYPLLDLADATRVDPLDAWDNRDAKPILAASERYEAPAVLVGRFKESDGNYEGTWQIADSQGEKSITLNVGGWADQAELGVNLATDILVARYAIAPVAIAGEGTVVEVSNITSFTAYNALLENVRSIAAVRQVLPQAINGDRVTLRVVAEGQLNQLVDSLNRLPMLEAVADTSVSTSTTPASVSPNAAAQPAARSNLLYRWR